MWFHIVLHVLTNILKDCAIPSSGYRTKVVEILVHVFKSFQVNARTHHTVCLSSALSSLWLHGHSCIAVPWLNWLVTDPSPQRPGTNLRPVYMGLLLDRLARGQVFLWVFLFLPVSIFLSMLHTGISFIYDREHVIWAVDSIIKWNTSACVILASHLNLHYELDGLGCESRWIGDFLYPSRIVLKPNLLPLLWVTHLLPRDKVARMWCWPPTHN